MLKLLKRFSIAPSPNSFSTTILIFSNSKLGPWSYSTLSTPVISLGIIGSSELMYYPAFTYNPLFFSHTLRNLFADLSWHFERSARYSSDLYSSPRRLYM